MNDDLISREEVLNLIDTAFENGAFDGRYAYENLIDAVQNLIHPLETDLVSRKTVIDTIEADCSKDIFNEWGRRTPIGECIINTIKSVLSVDPERGTGHWFVDESPEGNREIICSNCNQPVFKYHKLDFDYRPKFCPNCGYHMDCGYTMIDLYESEDKECS